MQRRPQHILPYAEFDMQPRLHPTTIVSLCGGAIGVTSVLVEIARSTSRNGQVDGLFGLFSGTGLAASIVGLICVVAGPDAIENRGAPCTALALNLVGIFASVLTVR